MPAAGAPRRLGAGAAREHRLDDRHRVSAARPQLIEREIPGRLRVAVNAHHLVGIGARLQQFADLRDIDCHRRVRQRELLVAAVRRKLHAAARAQHRSRGHDDDAFHRAGLRVAQDIENSVERARRFRIVFVAARFLDHLDCRAAVQAARGRIGAVLDQKSHRVGVAENGGAKERRFPIDRRRGFDPRAGVQRLLDRSPIAVPRGVKQLLVSVREPGAGQPDGPRDECRNGEHEDRAVQDLAGAIQAEQRQRDGPVV